MSDSETAAKALEDTARHVEEMAVRATADPSQPYRELQPMVAELADAWSALDKALAPLSKADRRALRDPVQPRMTAAATTLCRALFLAKMRDRASGAWTPAQIAAPGEPAVERLAAAIARLDFAAATDTLAPWLKEEWTADRLREELDRSAAEIASGFDLEVPPPPGAWYTASNSTSYQDVRQEGRRGVPVPAEVTPDNFITWHMIDIQTEEEDEYLTNVGYLMKLFAIAVSTPDGERVGYLARAE